MILYKKINPAENDKKTFQALTLIMKGTKYGFVFDALSLTEWKTLDQIRSSPEIVKATVSPEDVATGLQVLLSLDFVDVHDVDATEAALKAFVAFVDKTSQMGAAHKAAQNDLNTVIAPLASRL